MKYFLANIFSVVCAIGAIVVICMDKDGWDGSCSVGF